MKTFFCDGCGRLVFFENTACLACGRRLGFVPEAADLRALEPEKEGAWRALGQEGLYRQCKNWQDHQACNWMVEATDANPFCLSCRLNEMIPDLTVAENMERWRKLEEAKRRIVYTILRLGLPLEAAEKRAALRFKFLADAPGGPPVMTGHAAGVITVNIAEADDAERERRRANLHEPHRSLPGHLRHEVAHYYWDRLIADSRWLAGFRKWFGDETVNYGEALQKYYQQGPPPDWRERFVSAYASAHPWEDWAETWAHCFHIIDMVETAEGFGLALKPSHPAAKTMTARPVDPFKQGVSFEAVLENWFPLTCALNSFNRGMGLPDAYPFALSNAAIGKLRFVNDVLRGREATETRPSS